ncbi:MAG: hypothetical protein KF723_22935 [Rhizobiaceae bacterium]|nr:hypothetical protein [Rhizobiaceae bacterium]
MVAKGGERKSSANAGELDPLLGGRVDIKQYYSGGLAYHNIEPVPQAGFRQMPGTWDNGPVRGRLAVLVASGVSTSYGPHGAGAIVVWSASIEGAVGAVELVQMATDAGVHTVTVEIYHDDGWVRIGETIGIDATPRNRTFAYPPGEAVEATALRVVVTFASEATFSLFDIYALAESATLDAPRYARIKHDSGDHYFLSLQPRFLDIYRDDAWVAGVHIPLLTVEICPQVGFYTENATIGIFHRDLPSVRVRRAGSADEWDRDDWPYVAIPTADLGGSYSKVDDVWQIFVRWAEGTTDDLYLQVSVNGEKTAAIQLPSSGGIDDTPGWETFRGNLEVALRGLPSLSSGVTVTEHDMVGRARLLVLTFGGDLSGFEYQVDPVVTSSVNISVLPTHLVVGETLFEPILSASQGWPGTVGLVQDRLAYADIKAAPGAIAMSRAGEYFDLNIEAALASAARLDRLRGGPTAERVLAVKDATFFLVFTDTNVHFAANRTMTREEPLNYTITSEVGIAPNTDPVDLEGKIYYVAASPDEDVQGGHQVLSLSYDEIGTKFVAQPETLLASHLLRSIIRAKRQKSERDRDASRMWMMRADGLLVCGQVIVSQEILGLCRWYAAAGGLVREIEVDARNAMRVCVARGGQLRHERMDPALFLHAAIETSADLAGVVAGLDIHEGRTVWAVVPDGRVLGPFTVTDGEIDLGQPYAGDIVVGLWQAPVWESMPRYRILPNDELVLRPGRIHTARLNLIDTNSIAIGANGQPPANVPLTLAGDPAEGPVPPRTGTWQRSGMLGSKIGTTLKITQTRPGKLQVRDLVIEEAL